MNKQIKLTYKGKDYILEYNRNSIKQIELEGFVANKFSDQPGTMLPLAFKGAFYKNHRFIKQEIIDDIFSHLKNKQGLITILSEMIGECYTSLMSDEDVEGDEGNAEWEIV